MKKSLLLSLAFGALIFSSCTMVNKSMREPSAFVQWHHEDFTFSSQVTASAQITRVLGIDFARLFKVESGNVDNGAPSVGSIPVIGSLTMDPGASYALFNLMKENEGYDVVFYPQYHTKTSGIPLFNTTTVEVTARLAKIK